MMKMHMMFHVKVRFFDYLSYLLGEFGELPIESNTLKLTIGSQLWLVHLSPSWLVNMNILIFSTSNTCHTSTTMWKTSWGLSQWDTHDNPSTSNLMYDDIKKVFHAKEWNSFHL